MFDVPYISVYDEIGQSDIFNYQYGTFQVFLGNTGALDIEGNELPRLVYVSREKRPGFQHHKKAGAENALVTNLNLIKQEWP